MLTTFTKSQLGLFDMPVEVSGSVKKDGTIVKPHTRIQKVSLEKKPPVIRDLFAARPKKKPAAKPTAPKIAKPTVKEIKDALSMVDHVLTSLSGATRIELRQTDLKQRLQSRLDALAELRGRGVPDRYLKEVNSLIDRGAEFMRWATTEQAKPLTGELGRSDAHAYLTRQRGLSDDQAKEILKRPTRIHVSQRGGDDSDLQIPHYDVAELDAATTAPFGVPAGISKGDRRDINARVVALLSSGQTEYSDEDKALLRQYSGNGGCGDSLNEYYTDPAVATAMWSVLRKLGVTSGTALEPCCATGVFLHTAPAGMKVTGVEIESISANAAQALHGDRHEIVNASLERFATQDDRQFDVVIGNAPFGLRGSLIKDDKPALSTAEGYLLDTSLDKCKPGGIVSMIVPTGVMDAKKNRWLRLDLLRKGEFLGAVRMPNSAFEHSHTEVTTDVVFFKKRGDDVAGALSSLGTDELQALGIWDEDYLSGGYFEGRGASGIFGSMEPGWRAKAGMGQDITVVGSMIGVPEAIAAWTPDEIVRPNVTVPDVLASLEDEDQKERVLGDSVLRPYQLSKVGDTKVVDGITYILHGKPPRWHRIDELTNVDAVTDATPIAAEIDKLFEGEAVNRPELEAAVQAYIEKHGVPGKSKALHLAAKQNKALYRLIGAVQPDGTLSDAVAGRGERRIEGSMDTVAQSLAVERESGSFTPQDLADRTGKDVEEIEDALFASNAYAYIGDGQWTTMDQHLTGELWPKLDHAKQQLETPDLREGLSAKYRMQAARLEEAIAPKSLEDVEIMINSAFVPTDILAAHFNESNAESDNEWLKKHTDLKISFEGGVYTVTGGATHARDLLDKYLNRKGVRKDDMPRIEAMNAEFKTWLLSSRYRDQVEELYNRKFRGFIPREFTTSPVDIPGMNTEGLKPHTYSGLRWALSAGKGIVSDDVGLGKTVQGLMLARMAKVMGNAKRPTFVVPKSVLANWVAEADKWFPGSRVLVIGETYSRSEDGKLLGRPDSAADRNRKFHDMTQNDYDFVFISLPAFNELDLDPIKKGEYVSDDFWVQRGDKLGNAGDKRLRRIREAYNQAIAKREFEKRTDAIYFNDLGVDMLLVDEGHAYKNLYAARARFGESPKFLGGQGLSNRALDMNLKTRFVRDANGGNGVYMLTATPTKNSPLEIYSMLSHIAPEAFERIGIRNSEEFLDRFCEFRRENILATDGTIQEALVTTGFKNLGELREIMKRYINRRTAADVGLELPKRDDQMHMLDMTPQQKTVYEDLREQMHQSANKKDSTGDAHIFSIMDKMAKAAMDLELLGPSYAGSVSPKYAAIAEKVAAGAMEGGQVVFSEAIASHNKIVDALVDAGIPRKQIAIINAQEAESSAKRQNIADDLNTGRIKVVIGNKTMEEGVNLQKTTTDIHNLDLPWEPATMQQRVGRGLRQGNKNKSVRIHTYISKGSFDGYRYQSMMAKKDWQDLLWGNEDRVENLAREGRFDRSDLLIMMSADPEAERAKIAANKAAAEEASAVKHRQEAASEFVRFQSMKHSYRSLKNKKTMSAERLRANIERSKTMLANNKHFGHKAVLDANDDVLIHPSSGLALHNGVAIEIKDGNGDQGKWVVTGVDLRSNDVRMRRYGALSTKGNTIAVRAVDLASDVKPFKFDPDAEASEVKARMDEQAQQQVNSITSWDQIKAIPGHVIEANHDNIQRQLWEGVKGYKLSPKYGKIPIIHKETGKPELVESYGLRDKDQTHDFILPFDKHRDALLHAWMNEERNARYATHLQTAKRGKSNYYSIKKYPSNGYSQSAFEGNPWDSAMAEAHGETHVSYGATAPSVRAAREQLAREQMQRIRRAPTFRDALDEITPLGEIKEKAGENAAVTYPKKALAHLWAKARKDGVLGNKFEDHQPTEESSYGGRPHTKHSAFAFHGREYHNPNVHDALIRMAKRSGHHDLAAAMAIAGVRHDKASTTEDTLRALAASYSPSIDTLRAIQSVAEHVGALDVKRWQLKDFSKGILSTHQWSPDRETTVRQAIAEAMQNARQREGA